VIWLALATLLLLLADLFLIWAISVEDDHWIVKRRSLLGRDRNRKRNPGRTSRQS
jgi:hypothetical protein